MNFSELELRYRQLLAQRQTGALDGQAFEAAVADLRTQDAEQRWWQIDPATGGWLWWDGSQWRPGQPPLDASRPATGGTDAASTAAVGFIQGLWQRFLDRMITPGEFLRQGRLPLAQRSQGWWDVVGVAGGALSGYVWFLYASIRGMPHFKLIGLDGGRDVWYDFLPAIVLAALPFVLFFSRRAILARLDPVWSRIRADAAYGLKLGGGILVAALVLNYFGPSLFDWAFAFREGLDFMTPLLMVAMPLGLALFRHETDQMLLPLQPMRQGIPRYVLIGIALALPYALAFLLYRLSFNQYELLHLNVILGVLLPYVLLRNPQPGRPTAAASGTLQAMVWLLPLGLLLSGLLSPDAMADDCARDIFNLRDCLRTGGYAETMSGAAASAVSILINGAELAHTFVPPPPVDAAPYKPATIYGTGTPDDPFRDASAFKVGPDGRIVGYPETTAPPIYGDGSAENPYSDTPPPVIDPTAEGGTDGTTEAPTTTSETGGTGGTGETGGTGDTGNTGGTDNTGDTGDTGDTGNTGGTGDTGGTGGTGDTGKTDAPPPGVPPVVPTTTPPNTPPTAPPGKPTTTSPTTPPGKPHQPAPSAADRAAMQAKQDQILAGGKTSWGEFISNIWSGSRKDCGAVWQDVKDAGAWTAGKAAETGKDVADAVKDAIKDPTIIRDTIAGTAGDIKDGVKTVVTTTADVTKDLVTHPIDIGLKTVTTTVSDAAGLAKKGAADVKDMITDPNRRDHLIKNTLGINNFKNAMDPNLSPTKRLVNYGVGVAKIASITKNLAAGTVRAGLNQAAGSLAGNKAVETLDKAHKTYTTLKPIIDACGGPKSLDVDKIKMISGFLK
jgi:hypothetical protein